MKLTAKLLSLLLALAMLMGMTAGLAESDAVELNIFCSLASNSGVDANNLWWWRYAEYRLAQKGINVKLSHHAAGLHRGIQRIPRVLPYAV